MEKFINNKDIKIEHYTTVTSTNTLLKQRASKEKEGFVVIADCQTEGRGRFNRKFYSPQNCGIYMSILLKPAFGGFDATLVTTAAAVAVAKACEKLSGKEAKIKWVNDVLIDNKKVCGILTEGNINPVTKQFDYIILGIGINAFAPKGGFDEEIKNIAGSVFEMEDPKLKKQLTAQVINEFFEIYENITEKNFLNDYTKRNFVIGKKIIVHKGDELITATAISMDDKFRLLVKFDNRNEEYLSSGEISIKIKE